jgi:hypothetical protein
LGKKMARREDHDKSGQCTLSHAPLSFKVSADSETTYLVDYIELRPWSSIAMGKIPAAAENSNDAGPTYQVNQIEARGHPLAPTPV